MFDLKKLLEDSVRNVNRVLNPQIATFQSTKTTPQPASTASPRLTPQQNAGIQRAEQQARQAQAEIWNPFKIAGDIGNAGINLGRTIGSGIQQAGGNLADIALQGGATLGGIGAMTNPLIDNKRREQQLVQQQRNTEMLRNQVKQAKTITGESLNANPDYQPTGDFGRDFAQVAGRSLQTGLDATMFANPARALGGKIPTSGLLKFAGKDAALYGGGQGLASGAQTYGQTGDLGQAVKQGVTSGLVSGVTQGGLDVLGGLGRLAGKEVVDSIPTAQKLTDAHPEIQALKDTGTQLFEQRNGLINRGADPNSVPVRQLDQAIKNLGQEYGSTYQRVMNQSRNDLQRGSIQLPGDLPIVGTNLSAKRMTPQPATTDIEAPTAKSSFANNTVQRSQEVSDPLKAQVKSNTPVFQTVTDADRIAQSEKYVKTSGVKKATTDIKERLTAKDIDDQTVSDAISVVKALEQKPSPANLLESSAILEELSVKLSKAGQTVQAASLLNNRTPAGLQYGAIRTLKKAGVELTDKVKKDIGDLVDAVRKETPGSYEDQLARFRLHEYVSKAVPSSNASKAIQLWKAGLLTSPRTTAGNIAGNLAESVFNKGYVDPLANILDDLFTVFTGKKSRSFTFKGIGSGTKEGIEKGIDYFKTGFDPRNPAQKFDVRQIHYSDKPLGKAAEAYTQTVFKLMGVADQPFYYANLRNSLYDQAKTQALNLKLKGDAKREFIKKFVTEPEKKALQLADAEARYAVFQNETALGKAASRIKNMEGLPGDVAEFVIPFSGVPSSIATRMIERTPIGTAVEIVKQIRNKKFDQRAMTKAIANGTAAIPLIGAGYALANNGQMTLGYPTDKKERDLWEAEGKQPYSIKVGDQWLSLNYFQPAGNLMASGAEYAGALLKGKTPEEAFSQSLAGAGKAFSEQSFLKGVSSIGNAISDPSRFGQTFTESTAGSLVPNIIRTGARATDPVKREVDNAVDSIKAGIPGLRQTLDTKTNILGQDVQRNSDPLNETINPTKPSDVQNKDNLIIQELRRLQDAGEGIVPTEATKSSLPDLDMKQLRTVNKEVAQQVSKEWGTILNDDRYKSLNDGDKKRILDRVNDTVFGAVKSIIKPGSKLTKLQQAYLDGVAVDFFENFDIASETPKDKTDKATKTTAKKASAKKSTGARKGKYDYAKLLESTDDVAKSNQSALRKLVYGSRIQRKKIA